MENKILLNSSKLPNNVNVDTQIQLGIESNNKPIPLNNVDTTVSQFEQFEKERRESNIYRFYGVVKPIIGNPLFNKNVKIYRNKNNQIVDKTILSSSIFEKNGWVGYFNDEPNDIAGTGYDSNNGIGLGNIGLVGLSTNQVNYGTPDNTFNDNKSDLCEFFPFDPGYDRLNFLDSDGAQNFLLKITYPFKNKDIVLIKNNANVSLKDGIPIIEKFVVKLNDRNYTGFRTAMNHGLIEDDKISLLKFTDNTANNSLNLNSKFYRVFKLGNQTNDNKLRTFVIDVDPNDINFIVGISTIKRVIKNKPSSYYVRQFKSLSSSDYKDYDLYPAAYGVTYFDDNVAAFNFKKDINIEGLVDNLNRPLTELYLTIIKNDNDTNVNNISTQYWLDKQKNLQIPFNTRFWTKISAGYLLENNKNINYNIRSYGDPSYVGSNYFENIDESDNIFDGDIVEYNESELLERRLEIVYHRINTVYRENLNKIDSSQENKKEGYIYSPFNLIKIKEFMNYINPIVDLQSIIDKYNITNPIEIDDLRNAFKIPDYATEIAPNVYRWRDIMEIGEFDSTGNGVDYPFEDGAHYIHLDNRFYFQRQDPPCEFVLISEDITLGSSDIGNVQQNKFLKLLEDPTFLQYRFKSGNAISGIINNSGTNGVLNLVNYNGVTPLELEVTLADYIGEYELGKRDIGGSCIDFSILKEKDIDDVC